RGDARRRAPGAPRRAARRPVAPAPGRARRRRGRAGRAAPRALHRAGHGLRRPDGRGVGQLAPGLLDRIAAHVTAHRLLAPGEPVLALVSGGADSTLLAHALAALGHDLALLHVAHGLRGSESEADAEACAALAARLGVPFTRADALVAD